MSQLLQNDQDVINEGRNEPLKNVETSLRDQVILKLVKKLDEKNVGSRIVEMWNAGNADRADWLSRHYRLLAEYDEFLESIYTASQEWSSTLHLPVAFTICKTYHARMLAALLGVDPPFTVKSRQGANSERAPLVQELMRYTLNSWVNKYQGIEEVVDHWLWSWVTSGVGILKARWEKEYCRYVDVIDIEKPGKPQRTIDPRTGEIVETPTTKIEGIEQDVTKEVYNCPVVDYVPPEDLLIIGGEGDPQNADATIHQSYLTASELWSLADQKIFRASVVEEVISSGENMILGEPANNVKQDKADAAGTSNPDKTFDLPRYHILECYLKYDVDGSGINSDLIIWVHKESRKILRATYLYRVMQTGLRPFFKIDFHKRQGQSYGVGLVELLYTLTKEIDAMHNMRIDFGLLSAMPWGFYRPTASMAEERMPLEPGILIPLDNPQSDVFFPNLGNRTSFGFQEEQSLIQFIERLTSISDISLGIVGGQGATRTATGTRALLGESNANLDVYLRRMNRGWKRLLTYLFQMLQYKIPPGFQFRILGDDGNHYWETIKSAQELRGMYDFEVEPNSANSNKSIQIETANQLYQLTGNPLDFQLGIFTPLERYEAIKNLLQTQGIKDYGRYIRKPQAGARLFTPIEIANRALNGTDFPFTPEQDIGGFIALVEEIFNDDMLLGQYTEQQTIRLASKLQEAQIMQSAIAQQSAQFANQQQIQTNAALGQQPQALPVQVSQSPIPGGEQ